MILPLYLFKKISVFILQSITVVFRMKGKKKKKYPISIDLKYRKGERRRTMYVLPVYIIFHLWC